MTGDLGMMLHITEVPGTYTGFTQYFMPHTDMPFLFLDELQQSSAAVPPERAVAPPTMIN